MNFIKSINFNVQGTLQKIFSFINIGYLIIESIL